MTTNNTNVTRRRLRALALILAGCATGVGWLEVLRQGGTYVALMWAGVGAAFAAIVLWGIPTDSLSSMPIATCRYVCVTDLVPAHWNEWFQTRLSECSEFTYGDNNRTLISVGRFEMAVDGFLEDILEDVPGVTKYEVGVFLVELEALHKLRDVYIDLEN